MMPQPKLSHKNWTPACPKTDKPLLVTVRFGDATTSFTSVLGDIDGGIRILGDRSP